VDMWVYRAGGLVVEVGDGQIYPLAFAQIGRGEKEVESSVTAAMATLLSRDLELLVVQVESCRDEQESVEATPRGVHLRVNTLKGP
jgi:hypothetical protein